MCGNKQNAFFRLITDSFCCFCCAYSASFNKCTTYILLLVPKHRMKGTVHKSWKGKSFVWRGKRKKKFLLLLSFSYFFSLHRKEEAYVIIRALYQDKESRINGYPDTTTAVKQAQKCNIRRIIFSSLLGHVCRLKKSSSFSVRKRNQITFLFSLPSRRKSSFRPRSGNQIVINTNSRPKSGSRRRRPPQ